MYGIYNSETLEKLIDTVHKMHNATTPNEKLFTGQQNSITLRSIYANAQGIQHYSINSLLYVRTVKVKYVNCTYMQQLSGFWQNGVTTTC